MQETEATMITSRRSISERVADKPHPIDLVVDRHIFFDVSIGTGNVSFGLIVVVIRNEIFNCIFGEKGFEFLVKLSSECFIMGKNEGRALDLSDDVGHRERFARTCNAQQDLRLASD